MSSFDSVHINEFDNHISTLKVKHQQAQVEYITCLNSMTKSESRKNPDVLKKKSNMVLCQQSLEMAIHDRKIFIG